MFKIKLHLFLFIIFVHLFFSAAAKHPSTIFCADEHCSEVISEAQSSVTLNPVENHFLPFDRNSKIFILGKSAKPADIWLAKIGNKIGFVSTNLVKEIKVRKRNDDVKYEVDAMMVIRQTHSGERSVNKGNSAFQEGSKPEIQNSNTRQTPVHSSLTNSIRETTHQKSGKLLTKPDEQNLELKNAEKELITDVSSSPKINETIEVQNIVKPVDTEEQKKSETEIKTAEEFSSRTVTQTNGSEKIFKSSSDILQNNIIKTPVSANSDSQSGDGAVQDQVNSSQKSNSLTNESKFSENSNEKTQGENSKQTSGSLNVVAENDNQMKDTNIITENGDSSSKVSANIVPDINHNVAKREIIDEHITYDVSEARSVITEVPSLKDSDPTFPPVITNPVKSEIKLSTNINPNTNSLPNQNGGARIQTQLESDTGTVSNTNITPASSKPEMNISVTENLTYENASNISASVSSGSSISSSVSSNILPSTSDASVNPSNPVNTEQPVLPSPEFQKNDSSSEGVSSISSSVSSNILPTTSDASVNPSNPVNNEQPVLPSPEFQKNDSSSEGVSSISSSVSSNVLPTTSDASVNPSNPVNTGQPVLPSSEFQKNDISSEGAQSIHSSGEGIVQNQFKSIPKLDVSLPTSPDRVPYIYEKRFENYNKEMVPPPPKNDEEVKIVAKTSSLNTNFKTLNQQIDASTTALPTVDDVKPTEGFMTASQEPFPHIDIKEPNVVYEESQKTASNSVYNTYNEEHDLKVVHGHKEHVKYDPSSGYEEKGGIITPQLPKTDKTDQNLETEEIEEENDETRKPANTEEIHGRNFQYKLPFDSVERATDVPVVTERPENSNFEYSTPVPPPADVIQDIIESENKKSVEEEGFLSNLKEIVLTWIGLGSKKQSSMEEGNHFEETLFNELPPSEFNTKENIIVPDGICKATDGSMMNCNEAYNGVNNSLWSFWLYNKIASPASSFNTFIYLVVTAVTVLLFTLGYYFIEKFRSDGSLIAKVNKLEQELLVSSKECLILKDELVNTKEKLNLFETSSNDKIITALQQELEESRKIRLELENNIEVLQNELDAATEAGLDLNKMLSEVLTQKGGSETLMESVEHLQAQLNNQQKIIDEMTSKLFTKTTENQELQDELTAANEKIESLEGEIEDMRGNLNVHLKDNEDVIKELKLKNNELQLKINQMNETKDKEIGKLKKNVSEFEKKLKATSDSLKIKEEECNNLKDSVKKIKLKDGKSIDSLFESSRMKAELGQATSENSSLKDRLKAEGEKVAKLESKVKKLDEEIQNLRQTSSDAEKEKSEAQTRLEVLSNYFKEKETQLQKELGLREAMWVQKQGDDSTIYEKVKSLEEEISNYKLQNEALKKEILDQERGLKAQIVTLEKKAHDNWIAARQAERKLEEMKQEAAQLRNKMTMTLMEKNINNDLESSQHHRMNDELNGGDSLPPLIHDTSSPILFPPPLPLDPNNSSLMPPGFIPPMFMPPPPGGFMPHPPPFLPGDHRPPPLGRMSSPPLNNRFSPPPPPPDYAYDRMSTPPLSPSNRNYRSPNESDRERERFRHRTPTSPSFRSRNWEEGSPAGVTGFRPITNERDSRREHKGGSNLSSGHSSDSLDKSSRHSSRV